MLLVCHNISLPKQFIRKDQTGLAEELKRMTSDLEGLKMQMQEKDADYENRLSDMLQQNEEKVLFFLRNPG